MTTIDNRPWVEKYRPTQFDDIVLDPLNRTLLENIIIQNKLRLQNAASSAPG